MPEQPMDNLHSFDVLGIDPGITSGFALATVNIQKQSVSFIPSWEVPIGDFSSWLKQYKDVEVIVVEDFVLRPDKKTEFMNKGFTSLETAKLVGRVEQFCFEHDIKRFLAQASDKAFAYKLIGETYVKGKKGMHKLDAKAHARHYVRRRWSI